MAKRIPEIEATAYHEAGHAYVAWKLGHKVKSASIEEDGNSLGRVLHHLKPLGGNPEIEMKPRMVQRIEERILIMFAGPVAERHAAGRNNWIGQTGDFRQIVDLACRMYGDEVLNKYLDYMRERASIYVRGAMNWFLIDHIAKVLLKRKTITGDEMNDEIFKASRRYVYKDERIKEPVHKPAQRSKRPRGAR